MPAVIDEFPLVATAWEGRSLPLSVLLKEIGLAPSNSQGRRLIEQGAVSTVDSDEVRRVLADETVPSVVHGMTFKVGRRYLRLNFEREGEAGGRPEEQSEAGQEGQAARMVDAWVENASGERVRSFEHGEPINLVLQLDAREDFDGLDVGFILTNTDGVEVCQIATPVVADGEYRPIAAGQRLEVRATVENRLVPGHYLMQFGVNRSLEGGLALYVPRAVEFVVFGGLHGRGVVVLDGSIETEVEAAE